MKSISAVALSVLVGHAIAGLHDGHQMYHNNVRGLAEQSKNVTCGCTTYYTTFVGAPTLVQDSQRDTTTVQDTKTVHVQLTVIPEAKSASSASPVEVTSHHTPAPASQEPYVQASSSDSASDSAPAPVKSEVPHSAASENRAATSPESSGSANAPVYKAPAPAPVKLEAPYPATPEHAASSHKGSDLIDSPIYAAPAPAPKPETPTKQAPAPAPEMSSPPAAQAPASMPKAQSPPLQHASAPIATGGSQWCMTYSPYTSTGGCKSSTAVAADIASITSKGFTSVRLYSTDCSGLQNVGTAAASHGLQLVLGVFISETGIPVAETQLREITAWANGDYANVEMVVIGNEAVFNGYCTAGALVAFLASARSTLRAAGYGGPVTTTEPINVLQEYASTLCPAMDVASANIHPFFNADVSASSAGDFVAAEMRMLATVCPGKETYNLETGWPNQGQANGAARPGAVEQRVAVESIRAMVGGKSVFFSFEDDLWKGEGALGVERSWGCGHLFGD